MTPRAAYAVLSARNALLRQEARRLMRLSKDLVHDANNLVFQIRLRRKLARRQLSVDSA